MSVSEILNDCRTAIPDCQLVAFIDLDASMVLSVSSVSKQRQERLDALSASASRLFSMPRVFLAGWLADNGNSSPQVAIVLSMAETTAYVRSETEPREVLCLCGSPNSPVDAMIKAARSVMSDIGASE